MRQRGDTIVEVLFAVTIFSMVAVGGLSLMNQGTAMSQRSLEISLVRDQIDAQADALRYVHDAYIANYDENGAASSSVWNEIAAEHSVPKAQEFSEMADGQTCKLPTATPGGTSDGKPFAIDIRKLDGQGGTPVIALTQSANVDSTGTFSQIHYFGDDARRVALNPPKVEGIWVQSVKSPGDGRKVGYYDFHIRACWLTPGQSSPVTLGTIVRLYDPAV